MRRFLFGRALERTIKSKVSSSEASDVSYNGLFGSWLGFGRFTGVAGTGKDAMRPILAISELLEAYSTLQMGESVRILWHKTACSWT